MAKYQLEEAAIWFPPPPILEITSILQNCLWQFSA